LRSHRIRNKPLQIVHECHDKTGVRCAYTCACAHACAVALYCVRRANVCQLNLFFSSTTRQSAHTQTVSQRSQVCHKVQRGKGLRAMKFPHLSRPGFFERSPVTIVRPRTTTGIEISPPVLAGCWPPSSESLLKKRERDVVLDRPLLWRSVSRWDDGGRAGCRGHLDHCRTTLICRHLYVRCPPRTVVQQHRAAGVDLCQRQPPVCMSERH
jgi:hypothetical protein